MQNSSSQFFFKLMTILLKSSKYFPLIQERLCLRIRVANQYQYTDYFTRF
jgi:hypothetical protein